MSRIYRAIYPNSYHYYSKPFECPRTVMHYCHLILISVVHIDNQHAKLMKTGHTEDTKFSTMYKITVMANMLTTAMKV